VPASSPSQIRQQRQHFVGEALDLDGALFTGAEQVDADIACLGGVEGAPLLAGLSPSAA